jgi:hypothetical protein
VAIIKCQQCGTGGAYVSSLTGLCGSCEAKHAALSAAPQQSGFQYRVVWPPAWAVPQEPPKLEPEEFCVDALVGWRRWGVPMFQNVLLSNNKVAWPAYEKLTAECRILGKHNPELCKGIECTCGIYAYKEQTQAEHGGNAPTDVTHVWGQVYLWGRVVEHATGFRAQYAYPKALVNTGGIARQVAHEYGIPVIEVEPSPKPKRPMDSLSMLLQHQAQAMQNMQSMYLYGNAAMLANKNPLSTSGHQSFHFPGGVDAGHPEYIPQNHSKGCVNCAVYSTHGFACTLDYGHSGPHAAHGSSQQMFEKWD